MDRERVLTAQTVLVRDGRIAAVGPNASVRVPADAKRIDANGKFLTPGSRRMHAHVLGPQQPEQLPGARVGHEERGLYVERDLKEDGKFGRVAVGNWADLVLLDGNPLESLDIIGQRAGVMVRGRWGPGVRDRRWPCGFGRKVRCAVAALGCRLLTADCFLMAPVSRRSRLLAAAMIGTSPPRATRQ